MRTFTIRQDDLDAIHLRKRLAWHCTRPGFRYRGLPASVVRGRMFYSFAESQQRCRWGCPDMGAWGTGNFADDRALDFVWEKVHQPLRLQVEKLVADPACALADDPEGGPIMAAVELFAVLTEQVAAVPPEPDEVALWRELFLVAWDQTSGDGYFHREDAASRRAVIVATFDRLAALATKWPRRDA